MCFSAPASFVAGTVLASTGVITVKKTKKKNEIPLALIPSFFGIQQLAEGFVWVSLKWEIPWLNFIATHIFVFFAYTFWPIFVPIAIFFVEPTRWRKRAIAFCAMLGVIAGLYLFFLVKIFPISSCVTQNSIEYKIPSLHLPFSINVIFYLIATCISCLLSSHRTINILGIAAAASLVVSYYFYTVTLTSVWCFFAAALSIIIYFFFKQKKK